MTEMIEHLERRLATFRAQGLLSAQEAVNRIMSEASGKGALGGSRVWLLYDKAIENAYVKSLHSAAQLVIEIAGTGAPQFAGRLEGLASQLTRDILAWREERRRGSSAYNDTAYLDAHLQRVRAALGEAQQNVIGDFRFGVVGGKQMVRGAVQNAVTIQNVSDSIINVVQTGNLSGNYQELGLKLAEALKSPEVDRLSAPEKEEVSDLAGHVKDELANLSPEPARLRRAITRLSKALGSFGASTASGTLSKLIADYLAG